jgi:hypothetical protein
MTERLSFVTQFATSRVVRTTPGTALTIPTARRTFIPAVVSAGPASCGVINPIL